MQLEPRASFRSPSPNLPDPPLSATQLFQAVHHRLSDHCRETLAHIDDLRSPQARPAEESARLASHAYSRLLQTPMLFGEAERLSLKIFGSLYSQVPQFHDALRLTQALRGRAQDSSNIAQRAVQANFGLSGGDPGGQILRQMTQLLDICNPEHLFAAHLCALIPGSHLSFLARRPQLEAWGLAHREAIEAIPELASQAAQPEAALDLEMSDWTLFAPSVSFRNSATRCFFPLVAESFTFPLFSFWSANARDTVSYRQFQKSLLQQAFLRLERSFGLLCPTLHRHRELLGASSRDSERLVLALVAGMDNYWSSAMSEAVSRYIIARHFDGGVNPLSWADARSTKDVFLTAALTDEFSPEAHGIR